MFERFTEALLSVYTTYRSLSCLKIHHDTPKKSSFQGREMQAKKKIKLILHLIKNPFPQD